MQVITITACLLGLVGRFALVNGEDVTCEGGIALHTIPLNTGESFMYSTAGRSYASNTHCIAVYQMGTCTEAEVTCSSFQTKNNRKCSKGDFLYIADESNDKTYCWRKGPKGHKVASDFFLYFYADAKKNDKGFECTVTCTAGVVTTPPTTGNSTTTTEGPGGPTSGDCKCGLAQRTQRIVGGEVTEVNEYPWQAGMVFSGDSTPWCGATVISDRWVLTAQHCTEGQAASSLEVLLGEHDTTSTSETTMVRKSIKRIVNHPSYNTNTLDWDFALMELDSAIDFEANSHIRPACLPTDLAEDYDGEDATVTGWGTTSSGGSFSDKLLEVTVEVMSNSDCTKNTKYESSEITDRMMCAGVSGGGKDSCQGDSGGPLVSSSGKDGVTPGENYELIGVVSWGIGCAWDGFPGVYARVTEAMSWINDNISGSSTCPRE